MSQEEIDNLIYSGKIIEALWEIRLTQQISLPDAIDAHHERFAYLKEHHPEKFTVDLDTYWKGFYS